MFLALKKSGKKQSTEVRNIEFWIFHWRVVGIYGSLLVKADPGEGAGLLNEARRAEKFFLRPALSLSYLRV